MKIGPYEESSVKDVGLRIARNLLIAYGLALPIPVGAFALYSWLGGAWLLLPITASLVVVFFGIGVLYARRLEQSERLLAAGAPRCPLHQIVSR